MNSKKLTELRRNKGLSQQQLAERVGCTQQVVARWEAGLNTPRPMTLKVLAEILGCSMPELL